MFSWRCFPFVESAPRAYRLKASNAAPHFSTKAGTFPVITCEAIARIDAVLGGCAYLANTLRITARANHLQRDWIAFVNRSSGFAGNATVHFFGLDSSQNIAGRFRWIRHVPCKGGKTTCRYGNDQNRLVHGPIPSVVNPAIIANLNRFACEVCHMEEDS